MSSRLRLVLAAALLAALAGRARAADVAAVRAGGAIRIDGRIDEAAWQAAAPFSAFVQLFPLEGAPPGAATELRVLYDEQFLYVAFLCREEPGEIVRKLGSRDDPPP